MRIIPSVLDADLSSPITKAVLEKAKHAHIDVMDGRFVSANTLAKFSPKELRKLPAAKHVHLMVENPESYFTDFVSAGSKTIIFHAETVKDIPATLQILEEAGVNKGVAISPDTPLSAVRAHYRKMDSLLIMTVYPGKGGQSFLPGSLERIAEARKNFSGDIVLDGGITVDNIASCAKAGATAAVVGASLFKASDPLAALKAIQNASDNA